MPARSWETTSLGQSGRPRLPAGEGDPVKHHIARTDGGRDGVHAGRVTTRFAGRVRARIGVVFGHSSTLSNPKKRVQLCPARSSRTRRRPRDVLADYAVIDPAVRHHVVDAIASEPPVLIKSSPCPGSRVCIPARTGS
jgi:hypothetical protein